MSVGVAAVGVLCSEAKLADARGRGSPFFRHLHPPEKRPSRDDAGGSLAFGSAAG
jgi:hypothetical protein